MTKTRSDSDRKVRKLEQGEAGPGRMGLRRTSGHHNNLPTHHRQMSHYYLQCKPNLRRCYRRSRAIENPRTDRTTVSAHHTSIE